MSENANWGKGDNILTISAQSRALLKIEEMLSGIQGLCQAVELSTYE